MLIIELESKMHRYTSDLNDHQWDLIKSLLPKEKELGRKFKYPRRNLINAILYVVFNGVKWRDLPHDYPHWNSVYKYFIGLSRRGIWRKINEFLIVKVRVKNGRDETPSLLSIDSQSVKGDCVNKESGIDGNKKVKGIKRHIMVDVLGLIVMCMVTTANSSDISAGRKMVYELEEQNIYPRLEKILGDNAYQTLCDDSLLNLEISTKDASIKGFVPLRIRWKVERSFAWLGRNRRLNRNYERELFNHEQMVYIANIKLMLSTLTQLT